MPLDEADRSDEAGEEFDALPPDADEDVRGRLAERFAPELALVFRQYPWLTNPSGRMSVPPDAAQRDVMTRASNSRGPRTARSPRPDAPGRDACPHG